MKSDFLDIRKTGGITEFILSRIIRRLYKKHLPAKVGAIMNRIATNEIRKYDGKVVWTVYLEVIKRGGFQSLGVTVPGTRTAKENEYSIKMLNVAIDQLKGKTIRVRNIL